jgi:hypothetical protein
MQAEAARMSHHFKSLDLGRGIVADSLPGSTQASQSTECYYDFNVLLKWSMVRCQASLAAASS